MTAAAWPVLYEDNHLLVVNKPAMLPTMGVAEDRPSLIGQAKGYIKARYQKPGNVYLGIVSRLDAPVTGVVVIARTSKAASRLSEQFRSGSVEKEYLAIVEGPVSPAEGKLVDYLYKDQRHRKVHRADAQRAGAQRAELDYRRENRHKDIVRLEIRPQTGRKHQIRVQLAGAGWPILGDRKYGSTRPFPQGIALHAQALTVHHPTRRQPMRFVAPLPESWKKVFPW